MNSIKQWSENDRPREKLILRGQRTLTDTELLAIIIGSGSRNSSALDLSREILTAYGNSFSALSNASITELSGFKGMGSAKSVSIITALEIGRRRVNEVQDEKVVVRASKDAYCCLRPYLSDLAHEEFYILLLNRANEVISVEQVSVGGISGTIADGKIIFRNAIKQGATGIILAHNHPSGRIVPSESDRKLTQSLHEFGSLIDLQILDHLILGDNNYFSFVDKGLL